MGRPRKNQTQDQQTSEGLKLLKGAIDHFEEKSPSEDFEAAKDLYIFRRAARELINWLYKDFNESLRAEYTEKIKNLKAKASKLPFPYSLIASGALSMLPDAEGMLSWTCDDEKESK